MRFIVEPITEGRILVWIEEEMAVSVSDDELAILLRIRDGGAKGTPGRPRKIRCAEESNEIPTEAAMTEAGKNKTPRIPRKCVKCGHEWLSYSGNISKICPKCHTRKWMAVGGIPPGGDTMKL